MRGKRRDLSLTLEKRSPECLPRSFWIWLQQCGRDAVIIFFNLIDKMKRPGAKGLGTCYLHFIGLFAKNSRSDKTQTSVSRERGLDREALGIRGLSNCFSHRACRPFIQWKEGLDVCMRRGVRKEEMRKERRAGERSKSGSGGQVRDKGRLTFSFWYGAVVSEHKSINDPPWYCLTSVMCMEKLEGILKLCPSQSP